MLFLLKEITVVIFVNRFLFTPALLSTDLPTDLLFVNRNNKYLLTDLFDKDLLTRK